MPPSNLVVPDDDDPRYYWRKYRLVYFHRIEPFHRSSGGLYYNPASGELMFLPQAGVFEMGDPTGGGSEWGDVGLASSLHLKSDLTADISYQEVTRGFLKNAMSSGSIWAFSRRASCTLIQVPSMGCILPSCGTQPITNELLSMRHFGKMMMSHVGVTCFCISGMGCHM